MLGILVQTAVLGERDGQSGTDGMYVLPVSPAFEIWFYDACWNRIEDEYQVSGRCVFPCLSCHMLTPVDHEPLPIVQRKSKALVLLTRESRPSHCTKMGV